jgi:hypothetical protein
MRTILFILIFLAFRPAAGLFGQLHITEVMALNTSGAVNPLLGEPGDWIEIYNASASRIDVGSYYLSDDPGVPYKWNFPRQTSLPPGDFLLVWADGTNDIMHGNHTSFKLNVAGESLFLHAGSGELVDSMTYPRMYEDVSFGVDGNGKRVYFGTPTPGTQNNTASGYQVAGKVRFLPPAGIYSTGLQVELRSGEPQGTVRYTLDGSPPGLSDPLYTGPIPVNGNTVIRARKWVEGFEPGEPATSSYIISNGLTLPVISLTTDPFNLWDDQAGIYVTGTNGIPGYCSDQPRNWNQDWERPMSLEYFDTEGGRQLQIDGGVKIHGGCSRQAPMKSLGFFARSQYGRNSMDYRFFREKNVDSFKGLILRNAGNDYWYSFIRDAVIQATVTPVMDLDGQAYEPVQVFLNGEYWGIHNLREKVNEHWVTSNYGIPAENLDFIKNQNEVFAGSMVAFNQLTRFLEQHSLAEDANYQVVADQIDIGSYINYLITQMYFANRDWPGNNQKYWRDRVNGTKWRWILFDMEFSMGLYEFNPAIDMFSFSTADDVYEWPNPVWATLPIRRLLENDGFRKLFLQKYMMHLNTTFQPERVIRVIDSIQHGIYDLFPDQIQRWGQVSSMAAWEGQVEELRRFATQRPGFVWQNMRNFFSLGSNVSLHIDSLDHTGGISLNGVRVPREGFDGKYVSGFDLLLEFHPAPGYSHDHWEVTSYGSTDTTLLKRNSAWRYNDTGVYPGDSWKEESYNDSAWPAGTGELGYGDGNEATVLDFGPDDQNKHITYYFRTTVEIGDTSGFDFYRIRIMRDDGAVVYVNGTELLRDNLPAGEILPGTVALDFVGDQDESTYFDYPVDHHPFKPGTNTIAVEIHQNSPTSSDISFDLELAAGSVSQGNTMVYEENPLSLRVEHGISIRAVSGIFEMEQEPELFINEIMASNQGAFYDEYGNDGDWIEIYNAGDSDMDMAGLFLTDNLDEPGKWLIPSGDPEATTITAGGYLVFFADENPLLGPMHLDFRLSADGEEAGLSYRSGEATIWIDSVRFGTQRTNISLGRFPDGNHQWIAMANYTPGSSNIYTAIPVQQGQAQEITLYPNPVLDHLNVRISIPDGTPPDEISLYVCDLTGRRFLHHHARFPGNDFSESMDLSSLPDGVYLLVVETRSGILTGKFFKSSR